MTGQKLGVMDVIIMPAVGCEKVAEMVFEVAEQWLKDAGYGERVKLDKVQVWEHSANSAAYVKG